jgi:putative Mn2+ efflux pump MntP
MNYLTLSIIGIILSIDSLAASITTGACCKDIKVSQILKTALFMAVFQGFMPLIGWWIGSGFKSLIESYAHWIAFVLLLGIGGKLVLEGLKRNGDESRVINPTNSFVLAGMALATSIDALIIGIGFGVTDVNIWFAMAIIGCTTFLFSGFGVLVGKKIGNRVNVGIEIFGGFILIGLGVKIVVEHLYF